MHAHSRAFRESRVRAAIFAAVLAVLAVGLSPRSAAAHAVLLRTDPPDGVILSGSPHELHLWFSEGVIVDLSSFDLLDGDLKPVAVTSARSADGDPSHLVLTLPALSDTTFRLNWRTVSEDDLHAVSGTLVFGVESPDGGASSTAAVVVDPSEIARTWLGFAAFSGLLGALAVWLIVPPRTVAGSGVETAYLRRRLLRLALLAAAIGSVNALVTLVMEAAQIGNAGDGTTSLSGLLGTAHGQRSLATLVISLAAAGAIGSRVGRAREASRQRETDAAQDGGNSLRALAMGGGIVFSLAVLRALNSHAAAAADGALLSIVAATIHTVAAGLWVGGLIALAVAIVPMLRTGSNDAALARGVLVRFSWLAASSLTAVVATGLLVGGTLVASLDALLFASYGQLLILKVGLAAAVALVGLISAATLHPAILQPVRAIVDGVTRRKPRRLASPEPTVSPRLGWLIRTEVAGALGIVVIAAALGATPPAVGPEWIPSPTDTAVIQTTSGEAGDLVVTLAIRPNRPGRNFVTASVHDTRRPAPAPIERVVARLAAPPTAVSTEGVVSVVSLLSIGGGRYETSIDLPAGSAPWRVSVIAERTGFPDVAYSTNWTVLPALARGHTRPVVFSNQPLSPMLTAGAFAVLALFGGFLAASWLRRRQRPWRLHAMPASYPSGPQLAPVAQAVAIGPLHAERSENSR